MRDKLALSVVLILCGIVLCGGPPRAAGQSPPLPPGHPPIGGQGGHPEIPTPPADAGRRELVWKVPAGWAPETPSSPMRRAQYRIQGPAGAAECAVFYFGPGQGGDAEANAARWASQFQSSGGGPAGEVKRSTVRVGDISVLMVQVAGTYVGGMGGGPTGPEQPNHMLLGAIAQGPDANWFFRLIGPRGTVEAQRPAFEQMIQSIRRGKSL